MTDFLYLVPVALILGIGGLVAFMWSLRSGQYEDLDGAAIYFMSDASKFTTGQTLYVDGGWELSEGQY